MVFGGLSKADVVVSNYNTGGQGLVGSTGKTTFQVTFTVASSFNLRAIALFSSTAKSDSNVDFTLTNGTTTYTDSNLSATGTLNTVGGTFTYMTYFNFLTGAGNIGTNSLSTGSWTLTVGGSGGNGVNGAYYYTTSNTLTNSAAVSSSSETLLNVTPNNQAPNNVYMNFALVNAPLAVPEPGTLLLGSLAAVSSGAGVWWKRRKKKAAEQSEATEEVPAV